MVRGSCPRRSFLSSVASFFCVKRAACYPLTIRTADWPGIFPPGSSPPPCSEGILFCVSAFFPLYCERQDPSVSLMRRPWGGHPVPDLNQPPPVRRGLQNLHPHTHSLSPSPNGFFSLAPPHSHHTTSTTPPPPTPPRTHPPHAITTTPPLPQRPCSAEQPSPRQLSEPSTPTH